MFDIAQCDSDEDDTLLEHCKKWKAELEEQFAERVFKPLAIDLSGKWVLVTRFLRAVKPPKELISRPRIEEVMQRLARFVSLIPSVPDNISLPGMSDIWSTCAQFLEMLMGDEEEHAVLLCNFFLYVGRRAAVVLGSGLVAVFFGAAYFVLPVFR